MKELGERGIEWEYKERRTGREKRLEKEEIKNEKNTQKLTVIQKFKIM